MWRNSRDGVIEWSGGTRGQEEKVAMFVVKYKELQTWVCNVAHAVICKDINTLQISSLWQRK